MICKYCQKERDRGSSYSFYYGAGHAERIESAWPHPLVKEYEQRVYIVGSGEAWICRLCVSRRVFLTWILGALLFIGLLLQLENDYLTSQVQIFFRPRIHQLFGVEIGFPLARFVNGAIPVIMLLWAIGGIFGAYLLWQGIKEIGVVGENMAIKVSEEQYLPYSLFFNSRQYRQLKRGKKNSSRSP